MTTSQWAEILIVACYVIGCLALLLLALIIVIAIRDWRRARRYYGRRR